MSSLARTTSRCAFVVVMAALSLALVGVAPCAAQGPIPGTTAETVYGQLGNFNTSTPNNGGLITGIKSPGGVAVDVAGNLYVADSNNSRVLFYPAGSTTATRVYGQNGSFVSGVVNNGGISADSLSGPRGLGLDGVGNVYVADVGNSR